MDLPTGSGVSPYTRSPGNVRYNYIIDNNAMCTFIWDRALSAVATSCKGYFGPTALPEEQIKAGPTGLREAFPPTSRDVETAQSGGSG